MAAWSLLVWAAGLLLLSPLSAFVLGRLLGADGVISNEEVVSWLITPRGLAFLLWALASALTLSVAQFGGLFRLITTDRARAATMSRAVMALTTGLPARVPLLPGDGRRRAACCWRRCCCGSRSSTRGSCASTTSTTTCRRGPRSSIRRCACRAGGGDLGDCRASGCSSGLLPALPAFFDGHRPARTAAVFGWRASRDDSGRC